MEPLRPSQAWEEPPAGEIALEGAAGIALLAYGASLTWRYRRRLFPLWLAAFLSWFTLCKYLICTRCERYGERCEFYCLGRYAARLFPAQPGRSLDTAGMAAEGLSIGTLYFLPMLAARGGRSRLATYMTVLVIAIGSQFMVSCRRCVRTATTPWKATCPNYKLARLVFVKDV